jgi:ABC-type nitrate/sulfonate/bicarbonate transport system substrate-binding protein
MKSLAAVFILLALCSSAAPSASQVTTLRIGFNGFYGAAPFYLGQDAGIFRKQGIALEMVFIAGGSISTQALAARRSGAGEPWSKT